MKNILIALSLLILFAACKKENPPGNDPDIPYFDFKIYEPGNQINGGAQASVFCKEWHASAYTSRSLNLPPQYFEIFLETYTGQGYTRDQLSFGIFNGEIGEYKAVDNPFDNNLDDFVVHSTYNLWTSDGDMLYEKYFLDSTYQNRIFIDENDGKLIRGRFSLLFTSNNVEHSDIPGRVYFKEGKFQVKL